MLIVSPVEVASLLRGADFCGGLELHITSRSWRSIRVFDAAVYFSREEQLMVGQTRLNHRTERFIGVHDAPWVWSPIHIILKGRKTVDKWWDPLSVRWYKILDAPDLRICTAQTCIPSTSSPPAARSGSLGSLGPPLFPPHWCRWCLWTWRRPASSPLESRMGWSALWSGVLSMSQSPLLEHCKHTQ